jgi:hypothetical protein
MNTASGGQASSVPLSGSTTRALPISLRLSRIELPDHIIPLLLGPFETLRKTRIFEVLLQIPIKIRFAFHPDLFQGSLIPALSFLPILGSWFVMLAYHSEFMTNFRRKPLR